MTRRRRYGGVDVCSQLQRVAAKKTSRSCMGLSDVSSYCCGVALRYAAYRSAAITYETYLRSTPSSDAERAISREMDQISRKVGCGFPRE